MRATVAYQGESGAFSETAAEALLPAERPLALLPCATFLDVARAIVEGAAQFGVFPVENLIAGPVGGALDALASFPSLEPMREYTLPVHLALLGVPGASVSMVREVLSHPVALRQCSRFLAAHPHIRPVDAHDTAGAARVVAQRGERWAAAIAAPRAAERYGLTVLAGGLEDRADNATRFVLVRRRTSAP